MIKHPNRKIEITTTIEKQTVAVATLNGPWKT